MDLDRLFDLRLWSAMKSALSGLQQKGGIGHETAL